MTRPSIAPRTLLLQPPPRVIDGPGAAARLPHILAEFGAGRALLISGPTVATETALLWYLEQLLGQWHAASYSGAAASASHTSVAEAVELARQACADMLVSVGGGRAIDIAKVVAQTLSTAATPMRHVTIPTTLAGAAFTADALLGSSITTAGGAQEQTVARPADVALLDPRLTLETPTTLWQASGGATLRHAQRLLDSPDYHPLTGALARNAIRQLAPALTESAADPTALAPRGAAQLATLLAYASGPEAESSGDSDE